MTRRAEWSMQVEVARLFDTWLPADCFWTATDAATNSPTTGKMNRLRGIRPGTPDLWVLYRRHSITIELKAKGGRCSPEQRAMRETLLQAGAEWFECRSVAAVMWALAQSGVPFNMIAHEDGAIECWQQPELAPWEIPRRCPDETRPPAPEVAAQRRATMRAWRARQKAARATAKGVYDNSTRKYLGMNVHSTDHMWRL